MEALINYVSFVNWLAIGLSVATLLYFRKTRPDAHRPIKVLCRIFFLRTINKTLNGIVFIDTWFSNLCFYYVKKVQGEFLTFLFCQQMPNTFHIPTITYMY